MAFIFLSTDFIENQCLIASSDGNIDYIKYCLNIGFKLNEDTTRYAALNGHMNCLKFAHESGCPWDEKTCAFAALNGHFECLKYANQNGCAWDSLTVALAAQNGHFKVLKYAIQNNCPCNDIEFNFVPDKIAIYILNSIPSLLNCAPTHIKLLILKRRHALLIIIRFIKRVRRNKYKRAYNIFANAWLQYYFKPLNKGYEKTKKHFIATLKS